MIESSALRNKRCEFTTIDNVQTILQTRKIKFIKLNNLKILYHLCGFLALFSTHHSYGLHPDIVPVKRGEISD
jgi:hypothetical protein